MGIEYERKFVLGTLWAEQERLLAADPLFWKVEITQVYLKNDCRIRRTVHPSGAVIHYHTTKYPMGAAWAVEIEPEITRREFDLLHEHHADRVLHKTRYMSEDGPVRWDVDFLRSDPGGPIYFALAEIEMPLGYDGPIDLPAYLQPHILLRVPEDDTKKFSNFKLSDITYAARKLAELTGA